MKQYLTFAIASFGLASAASASFHVWKINEVFSNSDGSVQFIELFCPSNGQQFLSGHTLSVKNAATTLATFTFPSNSSSPTLNKTLLIGTSNLPTVLGVTPDFVIPAGFLAAGANNTLNFEENFDVVSIAALPIDGIRSLDALSGNPSSLAIGTNATASPVTFAGLTSLAPTTSSPIAISTDDKLIWTVNPSDDSVSVIRSDTKTVLTKISVGDEPESIALTPDGQYAYVANAAGGSVTVIKITNPAWGTFSAAVDATAGEYGQITTGAEPWNVVCSPDGKRIFVANSSQDSITVINTQNRTVIGHIDLRDSIANDPDRTRHFQPRGLAVTADCTKLYVTRFLSFTKPGGVQGDDLGKEGLVAVLDIDTNATTTAGYTVARVVPLAPQVTGFKFPGLTTDTAAFPNQMQSIVLRGNQAYLPSIAASPSGPLRFNLDTQAFVSVIDGISGTNPVDAGTAKFLNLNLGARVPEAGKRKLFFSNVWAMGFTNSNGAGTGYVVAAGSDLLIKVNVDASGALSFTGAADQTRYIDLNDPTNPATSGTNAGKNPQGIAISHDGRTAYVNNFVSRNVSVVDLLTDAVTHVVQTTPLPAPGSAGEVNLVGAEMFFSSRGNFDTIPGTSSLRDRLSSEGWQSCASCHFKGLTDGVVWQFGAGPRKSVPLNATFNPHNRSQQRVLNYSGIFDEVEDFELNIRNVSGPGPLTTGALNTNHGLLIGADGNLDTAPVVNAMALANANRPQVTVTLPGSTTKVPALTALREWVRNAVRTPQAPLPIAGLPNAPTSAQLIAGRNLFVNANCISCHGGSSWTNSVKNFTSPPVGLFFTERAPAQAFGNPVGAQYINQVLRDIGSFNLGVAGQGNPLGLNIGGIEKVAAAVTGGVLQPAQDALGIDYNNDGKGIGFNVPSLLGIHNLQPFYHNGAAESLAAVVGNVKHRTGNGLWPDVLTDPAAQAELVAFLEYIDATSDPFLEVAIRTAGNQVFVSFGSLPEAHYAIESSSNLATWLPVLSVHGTGQRVEQALPLTSGRQFFRVIETP
jgi:YVTN family beta-propeller protein